MIYFISESYSLCLYQMISVKHTKALQLLFFAVLLALSSCSLFKKDKKNNLPQVSTSVEEIRKVYHATKTRKNDLIHTRLEVSLDWAKRELQGKATLTLQPYFYPTKQVELDAKGMMIKEVSLLDSAGTKKKLVYKYDDKTLNIQLDKEYKRNQAYKIYIEYIAQPENLLEKKIIEKEDQKGLFFINADQKNKIKAKEMWTQGEPESNSCWFPTIENTSEKMTQEIYFTVDEQYVTLSNGLLLSSKSNGDGTRTDYWKHDLPHAPYLVMIAAGDFYVQKDRSGEIPMSYYVEHKDSADVMAVFGNTPEMIQFFSKKLGVPYPWPKYSQMIVRDFVAGAMENTSAVLHAEYVMRSKNELLDSDHEDHISHELFHHWFGDLVTCESWANLPLNESFANYSEYLWIDYKYGREAADYHFVKDLEGYLMESREKKEDLIRYDYKSIDDMFDAHSYNKGGCVLHMLRNYVGDDAFFAALKDYLESNKYKSAEIANLRMSFEKVTGEDLNWFFNQWFLSKGHPVLDISYTYNSASDSIAVSISQKQDFTLSPVFRLPVDIDIYSGAKPMRHKVWLENKSQVFNLPADGKPEWVSIDADKILLCEKTETKNSEEWAFQFAKGKNLIDRYDALAYIIQEKNTPPAVKNDVLIQALKDPFWANRYYALAELDLSNDTLKGELMDVVFKMAVKDSKSLVRSMAIKQIRANFTFEEAETVLKKTLNDSSNLVVASTLRAYYILKGEKNRDEALAIIKTKEFPIQEYITLTIADIYSEQKNDDYYSYYTNTLPYFEAYEQAELVNLFADYLEKQSEKIFFSGLDSLYNIATSDEDTEVRKAAVIGMKKLKTRYDKRIKDLEKDLADNKKITATSYDAKQMQEKIDLLKKQIVKIEEKVAKAIASEKNKELQDFYKSEEAK
ncbi:MAG: M1 family aminopeptidase [Bacteroidetes bacterium]|nr:M1 family aminopeptidase [Bacteroidota bacterium]